MTTKDKPSQPSSSQRKEWAVSYTQSDVDTIREHIEQDQAAKRRMLVIAFAVSTAGLVVAVLVLSTCYSLYAKGRGTIDSLTSENGSLKSKADECNRQLAEIKAKEAAVAASRAEAESRLSGAIPAAFGGSGEGKVASLAQMIYELPDHSVQTSEKPPDNIFHNWKVKTDSGQDTYTLVGGFVDGKWVIYSGLISRK
jgi:hypothetical protein